jgi:chaperone modulatory protein CbpM
MHEYEILTASLIEESWLTIEEAAAACMVEPEWLLVHLREGFFPRAQSAGGAWRFTSADLARARRMRLVERDFEAVPELAALVADLLEEIDSLRSRVRLYAEP